MDRHQAKILIKALQHNKEIVLPRTHPIVVTLEREGMLEERVYEVPKVDPTALTDKDKAIMRWIITGAVTTRTINRSTHIILYAPTDKARAWLEGKVQSRRNKDKRLLTEAGYSVPTH